MTRIEAILRLGFDVSDHDYDVIRESYTGDKWEWAKKCKQMSLTTYQPLIFVAFNRPERKYIKGLKDNKKNESILKKKEFKRSNLSGWGTDILGFNANKYYIDYSTEHLGYIFRIVGSDTSRGVTFLKFEGVGAATMDYREDDHNKEIRIIDSSDFVKAYPLYGCSGEIVNLQDMYLYFNFYTV